MHEISGLKPANGGVSSFNRYSPTFLAGLLKPDQVCKYIRLGGCKRKPDWLDHLPIPSLLSKI